jgi:DNA-binding GntR family transcriptional regulator/predicted metal-dependent enzyme (double-stranded beta helix superfamily)
MFDLASTIHRRIFLSSLLRTVEHAIIPAVAVKLVKMLRDGKTTRVPLNRVAFDRIKRDIINCGLEPGHQVTEAQLAARYALGKAPIRAALLGLCQEGFLRAIPRRGYVITPITMRDVQDIIQLRLLIEPTAARLAAGRVTDEHLARLEELCRERSSELVVSAHRELHLIIARASGNRRLADTLAKLYDDIERLIYLGVSRINPEEMSGYRPLVAALTAGDGEVAARLMIEQIELGRKRILEALLSGARSEEVDIREGVEKRPMDLAEFAGQVASIMSDPKANDLPFRVAEKLPRLLRNPKLLSADQRGSSPNSYRRHTLHVDPAGRFSVLALVWEGGQSTPAHDHTCWSVVGIYRGELRETNYRRLDDRLLPTGVTHYHQGDVTYLDLAGSDLHRLDNPTVEITISVHIYGADIRGGGSTIGQCYLPEEA